MSQPDAPAPPPPDHGEEASLARFLEGDPAEGVEQEHRRRAVEFQRRLHTATPKTWVTWNLVAANLVVFAAMVATGTSPFQPRIQNLLDWGADFGPSTFGGEWWRVLSATFVHAGVLHIGFNMWVLFTAGQLVERLFGNVGFLVLYLLAGVSGSLASL